MLFENKSRLCLGTMTFGNPIEQKEASEIVHIALDHGICFIDTADIYPPGSGKAGISETMLGIAAEGIRSRLMIATKAGGPFSSDPEDRGLGRKHLFESADRSLARLKTDYIDLFYAHFPDPAVSDEEFIETMNLLIRAGKIRSYGVSNFPAWRIARMADLARERNLEGPVMTENAYNLLTRGIETELIPCCAGYGIGITAFNPLAGGMLTGKYLSGKNAGGRLSVDRGYIARYGGAANLEATARIAELAAGSGVSPAVYSIGWILRRPEISAVILGASRKEQLLENLRAAELTENIDYPEKELHELWLRLSGNQFSYCR